VGTELGYKNVSVCCLALVKNDYPENSRHNTSNRYLNTNRQSPLKRTPTCVCTPVCVIMQNKQQRLGFAFAGKPLKSFRDHFMSRSELYSGAGVTVNPPAQLFAFP